MWRTLLLLIVSAVVCAGQPSTLDNTGWIGTLGTGERAINVVCVFEKGGGRIFSIALATDNKLDSITLTGNRLSFGVEFLKASFVGTLNQDGTEISGTWVQPGVREPVLLRKTAKHSASQPGIQGIEAFIPKPPTVVRAGGRDRLQYEIHITNWVDDFDITLLRVEILWGDEAVAIESEDLKTTGAGTKLAPGLRTVVLMQLTGDRFPASLSSLSHRITYQVAGEAKPRSVECAPTPVLTGAVRIAPPVGGSGWMAGNGPDSSPFHRGTVIVWKGRPTICQRFAFDFHLAAGGETASGRPVLAVADATVASVVDGMPDNVASAVIPAVPLKVEDMFGNRVTLNLGNGRYATYGHLHAGLKVKPGDQVRMGQVLGMVGNSGHSNGPHLHFQITDGPDPIDSEGIPFVFESFIHEGTKYVDEMPLNEWIVDFPDRK
jgi:murein DD-endopeptidase MepM/ murein hydrolase activator NlpD